MVSSRPLVSLAIILLPALLVSVGTGSAQELWLPVLPEQRAIMTRTGDDLPPAPLPRMQPPPTVVTPRPAPIRELSLDEAIRIALQNAEVIRILTGLTATSTRRTIYDTAITNTTIDVQNSRFDPNLTLRNRWNQSDSPIQAFPSPTVPGQLLFGSTLTENNGRDLNLNQRNRVGGQWNVNVIHDHNLFPGLKENRHSIDVSYTQPLLQGAGYNVNMAPIIAARIDTERSYFQLKDSVQELVRGVVESYWALVFARVNLWARNRQVEQLTFALQQIQAQQRVELADGGEVAQVETSKLSFDATQIAAASEVQLREAALRNLIGLPPYDGNQLVPVTPPTNQHLAPDWSLLVEVAELNRPDIVELKLVLEADEQLLLQANNTARPRLDAIAQYRWNGLEGEIPVANRGRTSAGQFNDWLLGVNFSVPLGLRQDRANLRRQELILSRDRANLQQGVHAMTHQLALQLRILDQTYAQYQAYQKTREAARLSLNYRALRWQKGGVGAGGAGGPQLGRPKTATTFLDVLLAVTDWGNAVSSEAQALTRYNTELAILEQQTGTILEVHGIRLFEERFGSIGPLGRLAKPVCYPESIRPSQNVDRYTPSNTTSEAFFNLEDPLRALHSPAKQKPPQPPGRPQAPPELLPPPRPRR